MISACAVNSKLSCLSQEELILVRAVTEVLVEKTQMKLIDKI